MQLEGSFEHHCKMALAYPWLKSFYFVLFLNLVACSLIYGISEVMFGFEDVSFLNTTIAMLASNISAAIPITPNGMGLSEFLFSKILSIVGEESRLEFYGSSYLIYRIFNIMSHACIYFAYYTQGFNTQGFNTQGFNTQGFNTLAIVLKSSHFDRCSSPL